MTRYVEQQCHNDSTYFICSVPVLPQTGLTGGGPGGKSGGKASKQVPGKHFEVTSF